jgi:hypothetical protein
MDWNILFGGAVLGSCIGVCGAATTAFFQRRFERRKWYADFFVRPQVEVLRALHGAVVGCQMELLAIPHKPGATRMWKNAAEMQARYEDKKALLDQLTKTTLAASIYLDDSDLAIIFEFRDAFYRAQIRDHFEPGETSHAGVGQLSPMADSYRKIQAQLQKLLYPKAVLTALMSEKSIR